MQFCLIDADVSYRESIRYHLEVEWPDAVIVEYDDVASAMKAAIKPTECDAVLLGCPLPGAGGLSGIEPLLNRDLFPPVLLFADSGDELLAVDAIKAGAASYFPKQRVTHQRLIQTLTAELGAGRAPRGTSLVGTHGQYHFVEELHSTEMSTVYLAEAVDGDGSRLAVKLLRYVPDAGSEDVFDRFLQEFEIIAGLKHPNVVSIFDLGVADDHAFIAMEYLGAGRLSERLERPLPPATALDYLAQITGALEAVHGAGILHRDLKPGNIMFRDDGSVALIDFGLAKWAKLEAALTDQGQIFGTPYYMSPEQGHAEPIDERADLYSLGCVFYEMLTAERPFTASTAMGVIYQHANAPRPRLDQTLARYQPLLDRLLAVDPAARFQSAREAAAELARLAVA